MPGKPSYEHLEKRVQDLETLLFVNEKMESGKKCPLAGDEGALGDSFGSDGVKRTVLNLADIVDMKAIPSLMDPFYALTGIGVAILDLNGKILVATGWQEICTKFHRVHPETAKN